MNEKSKTSLMLFVRKFRSADITSKADINFGFFSEISRNNPFATFYPKHRINRLNTSTGFNPK
jgi:hypothetical protein